MPPSSRGQTHLHADLLGVRLHGPQGRQGPAALHNDPTVLRLAQGQDAQGRTALLTHLRQGRGQGTAEASASSECQTPEQPDGTIPGTPKATAGLTEGKCAIHPSPAKAGTWGLARCRVMAATMESVPPARTMASFTSSLPAMARSALSTCFTRSCAQARARSAAGGGGTLPRGSLGAGLGGELEGLGSRVMTVG